jgi:hypothetical protein
MLEISGPNAIINPWTVMVHTRNAPIADATMMTPWWLVCFTDAAHGEFGTVSTIRFGWYSMAMGRSMRGDAPWICQLRLGMAG